MMYSSLNNSLADNLASARLILPEILIAVLLLIVLILELLFRKHKSYLLNTTLLVGLSLILGVTIQLCRKCMVQESLYLFNSLLVIDPLAIFFKLLFVLASMLTLLISETKNKADIAGIGVYYMAILGGLLGACFLVMANSLMTIYMSIALLSVAFYLLIYTNAKQQSTEASLKYLLYGITVSAIMLFGMSYLYGFTGTLLLNELALVNDLQNIPLFALLLSIVLTMSGMLFKMAAIPYHFWAPDVYQGGTISVIAYLSVVPKLASVVVMIRFISPFVNIAFLGGHLQNLIAVVAIVTIMLGNLSALLQKNVKRMMAYSSIAQAGFILGGIVAYSISGVYSSLFYSVIYFIMNFIAFTAIKLLQVITDSENIIDYAGLGHRFPILGACVLIAMLSLIGLPPTGGFTGKLLIFFSLWESFQRSNSPLLLSLFLVGIVNTVISLFYYLKIPYVLFLKNENSKATFPPLDFIEVGIMMVLSFLLVLLFFNTNVWMNLLNSRPLIRLDGSIFDAFYSRLNF
ncbi:MAG: NADH-quinone oxidoreductase subunit N [Cytophagales bacterium]|nr:NADH-quinone oxidoreductase subunit N [Cytophagales bacterium]